MAEIEQDCRECIHKPICDLWYAQECQTASCYTDDCFEPKKKPAREGSFVRKKLIERLEYISELEPPDVNSPGVLFSNELFMMLREACGMAAYELRVEGREKGGADGGAEM